MKHIVLQIRFLNPLYLDLSQIEYIPFDETWFQEGGSVNKPKYNSQELDAETGLYYYNARYYDGEIGRFVTADNVIDGENDTQGWNRYAYVKNNPVNEKDPSGNWNEAQGCMTEHNQGVHHHYDTYSGEVEKGDSLSRIAEKTLQWE